MMPSLTRKALVKFGFLFLAMFVVMSLLIRFIDERDTVLPGAENFLQKAPQVHGTIGEIKSISLNKRIYYRGIPGREAPYRECTFEVLGTKSQALITIQVEQENDKYVYRFVRLEK